MKLYLLDPSENTWYEIKDTKFLEVMPTNDLKEIYFHICVDMFFQNILDELESEGKIASTLSEEESKKEKQNWNNYKYTMQYIKNILETKMSPIEFKTFINWCDEEIYRKTNNRN